LSGVGNGGRTGGGITLKDPNKQAKANAYRNGETFDFAFGDALTRERSCRVTLTDTAGNAAEYSFEIAYAVNAAGTAVIIADHILAADCLVAVWFMRKRKAFKAKPKKTTWPRAVVRGKPRRSVNGGSGRRGPRPEHVKKGMFLAPEK
jgi:hypothetical protein